MTPQDDLTSFVKDALAKGVPRAEIESVLIGAGWTTPQVRDALATFADVTFPVPVPRPRPYTDAREAFLYGVLAVALGLSAYNLGSLIFSLIDSWFPSGGYRDLGEATRWSISLLVVSVPVFLYVSRLLSREIRRDPSKRTSKNRAQTTYLTLFICATVVIGVLAGVVYTFLGDQLTTRFGLKSVTAGGIAAAIFAYYVKDMREARHDTP